MSNHLTSKKLLLGSALAGLIAAGPSISVTTGQFFQTASLSAGYALAQAQTKDAKSETKTVAPADAKGSSDKAKADHDGKCAKDGKCSKDGKCGSDAKCAKDGKCEKDGKCDGKCAKDAKDAKATEAGKDAKKKGDTHSCGKGSCG